MAQRIGDLKRVAHRKNGDRADVQLGENRQGERNESADPGILDKDQRSIAELVDQQRLYLPTMLFGDILADPLRIERPPVMPAGTSGREQRVVSLGKRGAFE